MNAIATTRQSVSLTPRLREALEREADRLGISVSEVIRRVLDAWADKGERK